MSSNGENDGFFDRLAKKLFASESSPLSQFADEQRAERLASCRHLEHILNACQAESKNRESGDLVADGLTLSDSAAEKTKSAAKISRFFKWDKYEASPVEGRNETDSKDSQISATISRSKYSEGCHKEIHELWACRALAVGCGSYLKDLRQLWNDDAQISIRNEMAAENSSSSGIIYHDQKTTEANAREIQQMMAKCVTKNASELAGRIEKRKNVK